MSDQSKIIAMRTIDELDSNCSHGNNASYEDSFAELERVYNETNILIIQEDLQRLRNGMRNVKLSDFNAALYMLFVSGAVLFSNVFRIIGEMFVNNSHMISMISMLFIIVPVFIPMVFFLRMFSHYESKVIPVMNLRRELFVSTTGLKIDAIRDAVNRKRSDFYSDEWVRVKVWNSDTVSDEIFVRSFVKASGEESFEIMGC